MKKYDGEHLATGEKVSFEDNNAWFQIQTSGKRDDDFFVEFESLRAFIGFYATRDELQNMLDAIIDALMYEE